MKRQVAAGLFTAPSSSSTCCWGFYSCTFISGFIPQFLKASSTPLLPLKTLYLLVTHLQAPPIATCPQALGSPSLSRMIQKSKYRIFLCFWGRPGKSTSQYLDRAGLELKILLPKPQQNTATTGLCHHGQHSAHSKWFSVHLFLLGCAFQLTETYHICLLLSLLYKLILL